MRCYIFTLVFIVLMSFYIFADEGTGGGGSSSNKTLGLSYSFTNGNYAFLSGQVTYQTNISEFLSLDISTSLGRNVSLTEDYPRDSKSFSAVSSYLPQSWWNMNVSFNYNRTHNERTNKEGGLDFLAHSMMTSVSPDITINISDNLSTDIGLNMTHSSFAAKNPMTNMTAKYSNAKNLYGSVSYKYTPTTTMTMTYGLNMENGWDYGYQYRDQFIDTKMAKFPFNLKGDNVYLSIIGNYTLWKGSSISPSMNISVSRSRDSKSHANDSDILSGNMSLSATYSPKSSINLSADISYHNTRDDFNNEEKKKINVENFYDYLLTTIAYKGKAEFEISEKLTLSSEYSHESSRPKYYTESGSIPKTETDIAKSYYKSFVDTFNTSVNYMTTKKLSIKIDHSLRLSDNYFVVEPDFNNISLTNSLISTLRYEYSDELTFTSDIKTDMSIVKYVKSGRYKNSDYGFGLSAMKSVGNILQSIITYDIEQKLDFLGGGPIATGLSRSLATDITILPTGILRPRFQFSINWDVTPGSSEQGNINYLLYNLNPSISVVTATNLNFTFSPSIGWQVSYFSKNKSEKTRIFQYSIDSDISYQISNVISTNLSIYLSFDRKPNITAGFNYSF